MSASSLPLYAVIELIIRVSEFNNMIGEYKDHAKNTEGYIVKTTTGTLLFSNDLIQQQFTQPERIDKGTLISLAATFKKN